MRREATDAARRLWALLRNRKMGGFKFRRQVPLGPFIADFVCMEARLVIQANGLSVLRLWNADALDLDTEGLCRTILASLNER